MKIPLDEADYIDWKIVDSYIYANCEEGAVTRAADRLAEKFELKPICYSCKGNKNIVIEENYMESYVRCPTCKGSGRAVDNRISCTADGTCYDSAGNLLANEYDE